MTLYRNSIIQTKVGKSIDMMLESQQTSPNLEFSRIKNREKIEEWLTDIASMITSGECIPIGLPPIVLLEMNNTSIEGPDSFYSTPGSRLHRLEQMEGTVEDDLFAFRIDTILLGCYFENNARGSQCNLTKLLDSIRAEYDEKDWPRRELVRAMVAKCRFLAWMARIYGVNLATHGGPIFYTITSHLKQFYDHKVSKLKSFVQERSRGDLQSLQLPASRDLHWLSLIYSHSINPPVMPLPIEQHPYGNRDVSPSSISTTSTNTEGTEVEVSTDVRRTYTIDYIDELGQMFRERYLDSLQCSLGETEPFVFFLSQEELEQLAVFISDCPLVPLVHQLAEFSFYHQFCGRVQILRSLGLSESRRFSCPVQFVCFLEVHVGDGIEEVSLAGDKMLKRMVNGNHCVTLVYSVPQGSVKVYDCLMKIRERTIFEEPSGPLNKMSLSDRIQWLQKIFDLPTSISWETEFLEQPSPSNQEMDRYLMAVECAKNVMGIEGAALEEEISASEVAKRRVDNEKALKEWRKRTAGKLMV